MGKKGLWLFPVFALFSLLLTQCSTSKVDPYQNTLNADKIIANGGLNSSGSRGQAQSLYADALNNLGKGDPNYNFIYSHANFGLAMIGTWNGLDTISSLLSSTNLLGGSSGSSSSGCQPIDLSAYQTLLGPVIDNMLSPIVAHLQAVSTFTGFSFTINTATLVILPNMGVLITSLAGQSFTLDMSGAYDLGEVDGMLSLFETIQGGADVLFAYNGVLNAVANLLIGLTKTGCTMPNPLTDPNFGTLTSNGAQMLSDAQYLLSDAAKNMSNGLGAIMARTGDNSAHGFINYVDNDKNGKYDAPTSTTFYITEDTWGSEVIGQVLDVALQLLPKLLSGSSGSSSITNLLPLLPSLLGCTYKDQKTQGACLSEALFIKGITIPPQLIGTTITVPGISKLIYLTDLQSVSNALYASIIDNNGQHPLDIVPAIPVLVPRLLPVLEPLLAGLGSGSSTLGPLLGLLPTLVTVMFDSTGDAYTSLPVLPSIDLGAFLSNPPADLKTLAPLSYQTTSPIVGTGTYTAPEAFADGFVHVPVTDTTLPGCNYDTTIGKCLGYWTATASFSPGTDGSASGPGNVINGTVNGKCDAVTTITDSTTGTPLTYTSTGPCTGNPTSPSYSGEWYADSGDNVWHAGTPVCNGAQSNQPCFVNIYGDGLYHNAGDIVEQADEEQAFPFTGPSFSGITMTAWSDTGTDRTPDNLELGYNLSTNPDPYGDDINCKILIPAGLINLPWPLPNTPPQIGEAVCGEKNGKPDMWDNSLFSLIYLGAYVSLPGYPPNLGAVVAVGPIINPKSTPFFPRYHFWPSSTFVDPPKLITLNLTGSTYFTLINSIEAGVFTTTNFAPNTLDSIAIALPNDAYMFFPDPTFGGLLTVGQFNWCSKYQNFIGIPYNASAPCDTISYSTANMNNAQMNQYVSVVNLLINVLTGKVSLSNLGL